MDKSNQKILAFAFVVAGFLVALTVEVIFESLAVGIGSVAKLHENVVARQAIPICFGLASFLIMIFNARIRKWADECVAEIRKVVWPTKKETTGMTTVCCVMVLLSGLALGIFDFVSGQLVTIFVNLKF